MVVYELYEEVSFRTEKLIYKAELDYLKIVAAMYLRLDKEFDLAEELEKYDGKENMWFSKYHIVKKGDKQWEF